VALIPSHLRLIATGNGDPYSVAASIPLKPEK